MEYLIGFVLAAVVCVFAMLARFDRDRVFYPTMVIVVATYYILFAVMASSIPALTIESLVASAFVILAVAGFKKNLWLVATALGRSRSFRFLSSRIHSESGCPSVVARILYVIRRPRRHLPGRTSGEAFRIRACHLRLRE